MEKQSSSIFKELSDYFASNGVLSDNTINYAEQISFVMLCKEFDELKYLQSKRRQFVVLNTPEETQRAVDRMFKCVKFICKGILKEDDEIILDALSLTYLVECIMKVDILEADSSAYEEMYQIIESHTQRSGYGQFFTPRTVVDMIMNLLKPTCDHIIADTSCGSGIFLRKAAEHISCNGNDGRCRIIGIEKDPILAKIAGSSLRLRYGKNSVVYCADTLALKQTNKIVKDGSIDILLSNPPFGKLVKGNNYIGQQKIESVLKEKKQDRIEVQFIEKNINLLKNYGKMAIILPDGILGNDKNAYIRKWMLSKGRVIAVIDLPITTFQPHTSTKTSIVLFQKMPKDFKKNYSIFMAISENCGHDNRGKRIEGCDLNDIVRAYWEWNRRNNY